ncbi:hypothetical protein EPVG_00358 [Emiliania huxleyi virus 201]|nr:hypothetical protein ELVG_00391 [Emiliania huxleyi virus 203]AEP15719.1 hypothetical protein EQVG_00309 [Emiliania huxleyi virus 207]AEP16215.1 hypothetical protein ERVG_00340 [Emiliania huxleyi virus 208]AET98245.1 hypothetical protein EPVG_00358 [Emiliania huxleyi virus 201]
MIGTIALIGIIGVVLFGIYIYMRSKNLPKDTSRKPLDAHTALGIPHVAKKGATHRASSIQPSHLDWYVGSAREPYKSDETEKTVPTVPWGRTPEPVPTPESTVFDNDVLRGHIFKRLSKIHNDEFYKHSTKVYDEEYNLRELELELMDAIDNDEISPETYKRRKKNLLSQKKQNRAEWKKVKKHNAGKVWYPAHDGIGGVTRINS